MLYLSSTCIKNYLTTSEYLRMTRYQGNLINVEVVRPITSLWHSEQNWWQIKLVLI